MKIDFDVKPEDEQFFEWAEGYAKKQGKTLADVIILSLASFRAGMEFNMKMYHAMSPQDEKKYARKLLSEALRESGTKGGKSRSPKKKRSSRANGKFGGRPPEKKAATK